MYMLQKHDIFLLVHFIFLNDLLRNSFPIERMH